MRARDLGIALQGEPGPLNAITDVDGIEVGMVTLIQDTDDPAVAARADRVVKLVDGCVAH